MRGRSALTRRIPNAPATGRRMRACSEPYAVTMFCTETQMDSGHSAVTSPSIQAGQCR